ncbi:MAG: type II secretion system minor pseudopilin GspI [Burkholderiaceae bacterium]|nr:type II secretion system minor pseudopilin GspI [Burkholderiaceae bacterium]
MRLTHSTKGFTLIEVLVALGIVAVTLMAAVRASTQLALHTQQLEVYNFALFSAENRLTELRLQGTAPSLGVQVYACPQAGHLFECEQRVTKTPNSFFLRVEVSVFDDNKRGQELVMLATVMPVRSN